MLCACPNQQPNLAGQTPAPVVLGTLSHCILQLCKKENSLEKTVFCLTSHS